MAAGMVSGVCQCEHITLVLEDLHWLPVSQEVDFKMALMVWMYVRGVAPAYLSDLCIPATAISGHQHLRSAATGTLLVPRTWTATGQRSFAVNRPATWNRLPPALRSPDLSDSTFWTARRHWDVFFHARGGLPLGDFLKGANIWREYLQGGAISWKWYDTIWNINLCYKHTLMQGSKAKSLAQEGKSFLSHVGP